MANTIMTSKNVFSDGLVSDFAPDNTQATTFTSALNATLLTFNGNEMSLQNDMGNARVESAYLPEGYIPIGTCEFGDIIYIVSYNPLTNKSQVGCFPSPERNISSDEISDSFQTIQSSDFQEINEEQKTTGKLHASTVKKVLFDNRYINPGDKFVIYTGQGQLSDNRTTISDIGNTGHQYGTWPKLLKLHVVSIDESGKITYLDPSVKWYENKEENSTNDYFLTQVQEKLGTPDLDSYRNLTSSGYSIFQSKNSGKLAILGELEQINSFNCAYSVVPQSITKGKDDIIYQSYNIYLHVSWTSDSNDINPSGIAVLETNWVGKNGGKYRIGEYNDNKYSYSSYYPEDEQYKKPIQNGSYKIVKELTRIYKPELLTSTSSYSDYLGNSSIPSYRRTILSEDQKYITSFNYYINSDHDNYNVGWGWMIKDEDDQDNKKLIQDLRDVTRITQAKYENGNYKLNEYYFNLDGLDKDGNGKTKDIKGELISIGGPRTLSADIVNNYFKKDVTVLLVENYEVPIQNIIKENKKEIARIETDIENLIWKFKVAPCMPYGVLEQFSTELVIDFDKIKKEKLSLNQWKYWNQGELITLTYGFDINLPDNNQIENIEFEFYDNQGLARKQIVSGRTSYSGVFTDFIQLNTPQDIGECHAGEPYIGDFAEGLVYWNPESNKEEDKFPRPATQADMDSEKNPNKDFIYTNDFGMLYPNFLYKVAIKINYGVPNELGEFSTRSTKIFSRWLWTNSMYNDRYFDTQDFDTLPVELNLGVNYNITSNPNYKLSKSFYYNDAIEKEDVINSSLGAQVIHVNQDGKQEGNINLKAEVGLAETYNTLYLLKGASDIKTTCRLGRSKIEVNDFKFHSESQKLEIEQLRPQIDDSLSVSTGILTSMGEKLKKLLNTTKGDNISELWESSYQSYKDTFSLSFVDEANNNDFQYIDPNTDQVQISNSSVGIDKDKLESEGINLTLTGIQFNKQCLTNYQEVEMDLPVVKSIARDPDLRHQFNIYWDNSNKHFYFNKVLYVHAMKREGQPSIFGWASFDSANTNNVGFNEESEVTAETDNQPIYPNNYQVLQALDKLGINQELIPIWIVSKYKQKTYLGVKGSIPQMFTGNPVNANPDREVWINNSEMDWVVQKRLCWPKNVHDSGTHTMAFQLAFYRKGEFFQLLNNATIGTSNSFNQITYRYHVLSNQTSGNYTLADELVRFLDGLYIQRGTEKYQGLTFSNLCYASYQESWKKHIIVSTEYTSNNANNIIAFKNGVSVQSYLDRVNEVISKKVEGIKHNNDIDIKLLESDTIIDFQYNISNDISDFNQIYYEMSQTPKSLIYLRGEKTPKVSYNTYESELWIQKGGELIPYSGNVPNARDGNIEWENNQADGNLYFTNSMPYLTSPGNIIKYDSITGISPNIFQNHYSLEFQISTEEEGSKDHSNLVGFLNAGLGPTYYSKFKPIGGILS